MLEPGVGAPASSEEVRPPLSIPSGDLAEMSEDRQVFLTSREAAALLRIGRTKLWELTRDGKLPAYRVGAGKTSPLRYRTSELIRWLERNWVSRRAGSPPHTRSTSPSSRQRARPAR